MAVLELETLAHLSVLSYTARQYVSEMFYVEQHMFTCNTSASAKSMCYERCRPNYHKRIAHINSAM
jgi:hypothetical protein